MVKWGRLFAVFFLAISVILSGCGGGGGDSAPAPPTAPAAPDNVVAETISDNVIRVSWSNVTGATSYNLYYSDNAAFTVDDGLSIDNVASPYSVTGLNDNTTYHFMVTAVGPGGESEGSIKAQATTDPTPGALPAPTGISASPGPASATVNWTPVSGATSYNLYYSSNSAFTIATATKISGTSPGVVVTDLMRGNTYYFATTAVNAGGESALSSKANTTPDAPNPTFAQSDLTGTWNVQVILSGATAGVYRFTAVVDSAGNVTPQAITKEPSSLPDPDVPAWVITGGTGLDNTAGVVTESGTGANTTFHGKMSSSKTLMVGTSDDGAGTYALHVFLKRTGVTYSNADLAGVTFGYNLISSGVSNIWEIATGSTNASNQVTLNSWEDSNGTISLPAPNFTTISILDNTLGTVGIANESDFLGMMSADKKVIVGTSTDGAGEFSLRIIQLRGQTYSAADLAGEYLAHSYHNAPSDDIFWAWGTWTIDDTSPTAATVDITNIHNSNGSFQASGGSFTYNIDPQGNIDDPIEDSSHALMTFGKDMVVNTSDYSGGGASMTIIIQ